jgi:hypothetical protein
MVRSSRCSAVSGSRVRVVATVEQHEQIERARRGEPAKAPGAGRGGKTSAGGGKRYTLRLQEKPLLSLLKTLERPEAEEFFRELLGFCGIELPADWRERVLIGSDPKQSGTARENLIGVAAEIPRELPEIQKRLVEHAAPGLRALLGYA